MIRMNINSSHYYRLYLNKGEGHKYVNFLLAGHFVNEASAPQLTNRLIVSKLRELYDQGFAQTLRNTVKML